MKGTTPKYKNQVKTFNTSLYRLTLNVFGFLFLFSQNIWKLVNWFVLLLDPISRLQLEGQEERCSQGKRSLRIDRPGKVLENDLGRNGFRLGKTNNIHLLIIIKNEYKSKFMASIKKNKIAINNSNNGVQASKKINSCQFLRLNLFLFHLRSVLNAKLSWRLASTLRSWRPCKGRRRRASSAAGAARTAAPTTSSRPGPPTNRWRPSCFVSSAEIGKCNFFNNES